MKPLVVLLALLPTAALAQSYDAAPVVRTQATGGSAAVVDASMDVAAPPAAVWAALTDCEGAPRYMPKLISCKVVTRGPGGRWEIREHRLKGGLLKRELRSVFRADFDPQRRLAFRRVAGDWKTSQGEWRMKPIGGGKGTHVTYHIEAEIDAPVPARMVRSAIAKGMPEAMLALRRESVARAGRKE